MIVLMAASAILEHLRPEFASVNILGTLQFFLTGFLLADIRATRHVSQQSRWWDVVSLAAWAGLFGLSSEVTDYVLPVLILLACLGAFNGPVFRSMFKTGWVAITGGMCYSFYLMHLLVLEAAGKLTLRLVVPSSFLATCLIQVVLLGSCVSVVCTLYYIAIERPCMNPEWPVHLLTRAQSLRRSQRGVHRRVASQ